VSKPQESRGREEKDALDRYRELLLDAEEKAQTEYDRLIVALSGGALGVSFAFIHQFITDKPAQWISCLTAAWTLWVISLASVLASHYFSVEAMRKTIAQVDGKKIRKEKAGGEFDVIVNG